MSSISGIANANLLRDRGYIDGKWVDAIKGHTFPIVNPATGKIIAHVPAMTDEDVIHAISAAKSSFTEWRGSSYKKREDILNKWATLIKQNTEDIANIMTAESGKPLKQSRGEVVYATSFLEFYAEETKRMNGTIIPSPSSSQRLLVSKQAIGVCALITPWNFPAAMITRKAGVALAAGCSVVLKPAEDTPLTALALAHLAEEAGVPRGVFNVITTSRSEVEKVGELLCSHPDVRKISFTGSTKVGKILLKHAASGVKKASMELGGNAPFIVFNDADIDSAVSGLMATKFRFSGQTCISANRILVQKDISEEFTKKVLGKIEKLVVGDPYMSTTDIGPLINHTAVSKVKGMLIDAIEKGAHPLIGGEQAIEKYSSEGPSYFKPILLKNCSTDMDVCKYEIFGPIIPIMTFDTENEALEIANSSPSGLAGYVYTRDYSRIFRMSEKLEVGMVGVNDTSISSETMPFGGIKESGLGREGSSFGLDEYLEMKFICLGGL